jgi:FkbM family methyltransferase
MELTRVAKQWTKRIVLPTGVRPYRIRGGRLKGMWFHFDLQHDTQVWRGIYERALQDWLAEHVDAESVCIDVGAAEGWATLLMASLAKRGMVVALEPSARGDWIEDNLRINDGSWPGRVDIHRVCAGKRSEFDAAGTEFVSLDDLVRDCGLERVDVVKIDVDGPELDVLDGAIEMLARFRPAVCVEAHSHQLLDGVCERLARAGYATTVVDPPPHEHRPIEYNPMVFANWVGRLFPGSRLGTPCTRGSAS